MIKVSSVSFKIGKSYLLKDVSLEIAACEFVVIMGANGAGKSTLLKLIASSLKPEFGDLHFKDKAIRELPLELLAKQRAVLSQHYHIGFPLSVKEVVMMGRYPYFDQVPTLQDLAIVNNIMKRLSVNHLAERNYQTLSGGEAQKVQMCRVLAQIGETSADEQKLLLLDEPVSHLDIKYQHQILDEAKLLTTKNVGVLAVLHDINLALKYADRILFMKGGRLTHEIKNGSNLSVELLKEVFDVDAWIIRIPDTDQIYVSF